MSFSDLIKDHWEKGSATVATALAAALAFQKDLSEISLGLRFFIGSFAGLWATLSVAEMLARKPKERSIGFPDKVEEPAIPIWWFAVRVILLLIVCALSVFLLRQIATFHNVRVLESTHLANPFEGIIEVQPAHRATNLTVSLSTSQAAAVQIVGLAPASWNNQDPADWRMQNETPFGVTLILRDFKSPQVFGVWYKLSASSQELDVDVRPDPAEVSVIRGSQFYKYQRNIWIFGGVLWTVALVFWSYRSSWFRPIT
jgi:hypothetical protein